MVSAIYCLPDRSFEVKLLARRVAIHADYSVFDEHGLYVSSLGLPAMASRRLPGRSVSSVSGPRTTSSVRYAPSSDLARRCTP